MVGVSAALVLGAGVGQASAAADRPGTNPPAGSHKIVFPTREAVQSLAHTANASTPTATTVGSGQLAYRGGVNGIGVTTGAPKVYLIFWGSQWGAPGTSPGGRVTLANDSAGMAPRLQDLFLGIGTNSETWSGVMTQYCEGVATGATSCPSSAPHVGYPAGNALGGVWADVAAAAPASATGHQLGAEAVAAAAHFGNTTAAANRNAQYVVVSPTGTHPDGFNTASGKFCAWHDFTGDTTLTGGGVSSSYGDIAFTNLPYVTDAGTSCGKGYVNTGSAGNLDGVTIVEGHEYAETITDQNPAGGWTDSTGYENADKCAWVGVGGTGGAQNLTFATGSFAMQSTWSNDATGCQISHPVVGGGSGGGGNCAAPGQKLVNPGFESGSASWTASSGVISNATSNPAHGGAWYAKLAGTGSTLTQNLSQPVSLPSGCSSYTLTFWVRITTAETTRSTAFDTLTVKAAGGSRTTTLATYSNLDASSGYLQKSLDLSRYAGTTVTLTFTGAEDSSLATTFLLDDTAVTIA
ncbi:MAG TPA: hypothetical protein VI248_13335 [Kineosporiaceae bacterium]